MDTSTVEVTDVIDLGSGPSIFCFYGRRAPDVGLSMDTTWLAFCTEPMLLHEPVTTAIGLLFVGPPKGDGDICGAVSVLETWVTQRFNIFRLE